MDVDRQVVRPYWFVVERVQEKPTQQPDAAELRTKTATMAVEVRSRIHPTLSMTRFSWRTALSWREKRPISLQNLGMYFLCQGANSRPCPELDAPARFNSCAVEVRDARSCPASPCRYGLNETRGGCWRRSFRVSRWIDATASPSVRLGRPACAKIFRLPRDHEVSAGCPRQTCRSRPARAAADHGGSESVDADV
jgi:hypothetical protein